MMHKLKDAPAESVARGKCRHYWIIESPHGPTSMGVCKFCGAEKEFKNYLPDSWRERIIPMLNELDSFSDAKLDDEGLEDF